MDSGVLPSCLACHRMSISTVSTFLVFTPAAGKILHKNKLLFSTSALVCPKTQSQPILHGNCYVTAVDSVTNTVSLFCFLSPLVQI